MLGYSVQSTGRARADGSLNRRYLSVWRRRCRRRRRRLRVNDMPAESLVTRAWRPNIIIPAFAPYSREKTGRRRRRARGHQNATVSHGSRIVQQRSARRSFADHRVTKFFVTRQVSTGRVVPDKSHATKTETLSYRFFI